MASGEARKSRILVTGFGPFPGAPVNPTQMLVERLRAAPPEHPGMADFRAELLDVDYAAIVGRLSAIGRDCSPDIAIHFGLARQAGGFRLERVARNAHAGARADNRGRLPSGEVVCDGPPALGSTLPLDVIAEKLTAEGLPVEWSDDAGGYLCNMVFVLSRFHACEAFRPAVSGFIHVPLLAAKPKAGTMGIDDLLRGARIIIAATMDAHAYRSG